MWRRSFMVCWFFPISIAFAVQVTDYPSVPAWRSYYLGGNIGVAWSQVKNHLQIQNNGLFNAAVISGVEETGSTYFNPLRFAGGVQVGINRDWMESGLVGLELSYEAFNLSQIKDKLNTYTVLPAHFYQFDTKSSLQQMGTLRPRIGVRYKAYVPYITGGGALTRLRFHQTFTDVNYAFSDTTTYRTTCLGWTLGAGIEYRPLQRWSYKIEYLYHQSERYRSKINIKEAVCSPGLVQPIRIH